MKTINATPAKINTIRKRAVRGQVRGSYFQILTLPGLCGEEEKKSKGRIEGSRVGWKGQGFGGGLVYLLSRQHMHAALLPAGFSKAVHDLSLAHRWSLQT